MRSFIKACAFIAKLAVSIICIFAVVHKIAPSAIAEDLSQIRWPWLCLALAQYAVLPVLGGYRWRVVLKSLDSVMTPSVAIGFFWAGMAFSQILPSVSGGDAVRVILAWRQGIALTIATQSVALERVAMISTLVLAVALMQIGGAYAVPGPAYIFPLAVAAVFGGVVILLIADRLTAALPKWRAASFFSDFAENARRVYRGRIGLALTAASLTAHFNTALGCLWLGKSLGLSLSLADFMFYISLVTLISTLPLSIGGWGVREGMVAYLFGGLGIAAHTAVTFSVLFGLSVAAISAPGFFYIWMRRRAKGPLSPPLPTG